MKTLVLMRHAKSSWKHAELADKDRPLNKRGEKDALKMGKLLKAEDLAPQVIYSSTAARAVKTAEAIASKTGYKKEIIFLESLYMAELSAIIHALQSTPDEAKRVLLIGHNPGLEGLVQILSHKVESLPTAAVAIFKLPIEHWKKLTLETEAKLKKLWVPKDRDK